MYKPPVCRTTIQIRSAHCSQNIQGTLRKGIWVQKILTIIVYIQRELKDYREKVTERLQREAN